MTDESLAGGPIESPAQAIDRLAQELEGIRRSEVGKAVEFDRAGVVFATREAGRLSFRLRAEIVAAALKTPDTSTSERGSDWVSIAPAVVNSFALDRSTAWFEIAWRIAGEQSAGKRPVN